MNIRLGRIGAQEGVSIAAIALSIGGVFTFETKPLYEHGNSTYITLPLAVLLSLGLFILLISVMEKYSAKNLGELISLAYGGFVGPVASIVLMLMLLLAAYAPLSQFIQAMHGLFYDGVSYTRLSLFILPTVLIVALLGFETIGRVAKCFSVFLFVMLAAAVLASSTEFEIYRLYPLFGNGAKGMLIQTIQEIGTFFPAMLSMLVVSDGLNDRKTIRRVGVISAVIAAMICFVAQLALGLVYTYSELTELFMPLFRVNYLSKFEAHLMRLDKIAHMTWLNGGIITGAFHLYAASRLFIQAFDIRDIRPTITASSMLLTVIILLEFESNLSYLFSKFKDALIGFGFLGVAVIPLAAALLAAVRRTSKPERSIKNAV